MSGDLQQARRERLRDLMDGLGLGGIVLRSPANFAWYTGGADNRVDHASAVGVADMVVTRDGEWVHTNDIEASRMREEQTPRIEVVEYPWYQGQRESLRELTRGVELGADVPSLDERNVEAAVAPLRHVLDIDAIERYRGVGRDASLAINEVAESLEPGVSELEATARLAGACRRRGLFAPVIIAAGDERIVRYRHPIPRADSMARHRVMLVTCVERGGLYANLTRFVLFDEPDSELRRRFEASQRILRRLREEATRPGRTLAEAFDECCRFYAEEGFPDEWKLHHQGGMTGYASREVVATPQTQEEIRVGQAFAWNPSITGAKAEETFVLTESGAEVVTQDPEGPVATEA